MYTDPCGPTIEAAAAPRVSVITPHYNQRTRLRRCLESLARQSLADSAYEIIVCDNATPGGVDDLKADFPNVRFITESRRGAAHARNAALRIARGEAVAFIDADCVADPAWLEAGLAALEASPLAGGEVVVSVGDCANLSPVEAFVRIFAFRQRDYIERKRFSVTANLFATRAAADAIGPFAHGIAEDVDWCGRARALGIRLAFNAKPIVNHPARRNWAELTAKWDRLIQERWNGFGGRCRARQAVWVGLAIITALSSAPHLAKVASCPRVGRWRDRFAAAAVLVRIRLWRARKMLAML